MKKPMQLCLLTLVVFLLNGCATNADVKHIQTQIDALKTSVAQVSSNAAAAKYAANDAKVSAERAAKDLEKIAVMLNITCVGDIDRPCR